jgi:hypothetical protein
LAIGGGAWSLWRVLDNTQGTGALTIGAWTAFPNIGSPDADPYSRARTSREGILALGSAEGIAFTATTDSAGDTLRSECSYRIEGDVPASRFWTLVATTDQPAEENPQRLPALNSSRSCGGLTIASRSRRRRIRRPATGWQSPVAVVCRCC